MRVKVKSACITATNFSVGVAMTEDDRVVLYHRCTYNNKGTINGEVFDLSGIKDIYKNIVEDNSDRIRERLMVLYLACYAYSEESLQELDIIKEKRDEVYAAIAQFAAKGISPQENRRLKRNQSARQARKERKDMLDCMGLRRVRGALGGYYIE